MCSALCGKKNKSSQPTVPPLWAVSPSFLHLPDSPTQVLWTLPILAAPRVAMPSLQHLREGLKEAAEAQPDLGDPSPT